MEADSKVDHILARLASIDTTLKFQAKQLENHIKRTDLLEQRLTPIEDHVKFIQGLMKVGTYIASLSGAASLVLKLLGKW